MDDCEFVCDFNHVICLICLLCYYMMLVFFSHFFSFLLGSLPNIRSDSGCLMWTIQAVQPLYSNRSWHWLWARPSESHARKTLNVNQPLVKADLFHKLPETNVTSRDYSSRKAKGKPMSSSSSVLFSTCSSREEHGWNEKKQVWVIWTLLGDTGIVQRRMAAFPVCISV